MGDFIPFCGLSEAEFDKQVAALRGKVEPKRFQKRKQHATIEEWAAHREFGRQRYANNREYYIKASTASAKRRNESVSSRKKAHYQKNKEARRVYARAHYEKNREEILAKNAKYYEENQPAIVAQKVEYRRGRLEKDDLFRFKESLRTLIRESFRKGGFSEKGKTESILGCSWSELTASFFTPEMTLANREEWHIEHIIPFRLADTVEKATILSHHHNLRPLWGPDNLKKGGKVYRDLVAPVLKELVPIFGPEPFREMLAGVEWL